jgi:1-acyl-sn-glycerol-3-phosphate acyltransferase
MHHVPKTGPALVIANHQSFIDPVLIGVAAHRRLCYLARKTLFKHRILAQLMTSFNAFPVDQEGFAREGLVTLIRLLHDGQAVLLFPEGERSWKGNVQELRPGVHLLIKKTKAPIVPVGVAGAYESWPRTRMLPILSPVFWPAGKGRMAVSIGKPLDGAALAERPRAEVLQLLHANLLERKARAEHLRGVDR